MVTRIPLRLFLCAIGASACSSSTAPEDPLPDATATDTAGETSGDAGSVDATPPEGTTPLVDPTSKVLYDAPFPSDLRRTSDGHVDWSGFPNPGGIGLVDDYVEFAGKVLDGFGLTPAVTFRFDGPIDLGTVPSGSATTDAASAIQIVALDPDAPDYGKRSPLTRAWWGTQATIFVPQSSLTIEPVFGLPLREGARYAAFVTTRVADPKGRPLRANALVSQGLSGEGPLAALYAPLRAWLETKPGVAAEDIAVATVFTTGHPTAELRAVRKFIREAPAPAITDIKLVNEDKGSYALYEGHYDAPNFQAGAKPYDKDGDFRFETDGTPITTPEHIRFALAVPRDLPMPEKGWPVALYGHGTGGDWKTFLNEQPHPVGTELLKLGIAVVSIDQPLHGDRWFESHPATNLDLQSFNFFNPAAGRSNFRQSAADVMVLSRVAHDTLKVPAEAAYKNEEVHFDTDRVFFFGHSHGGLSGAMVAALEPDFRGYVLSGAGAGLSNTILLRKEPYDIAEVMRQALGMDNEYELSIWHPFVTLVQNLADATDPLSYAPFYLNRGDGLRPPNVLLTEGTIDVDTPAITTDTLAAAARIPILNPQVHDSPAHVLLGLDLAYAPLSANFGEGATATTAVLRQFGGDGHFAVFQNADAVKLYTGFIASMLASEVGKIL